MAVEIIEVCEGLWLWRQPHPAWDADALGALRSDIDDIQGGTTAEGIHTGVMAGTLYLVQRIFLAVPWIWIMVLGLRLSRLVTVSSPRD